MPGWGKLNQSQWVCERGYRKRQPKREYLERAAFTVRQTLFIEDNISFLIKRDSYPAPCWYPSLAFFSNTWCTRRTIKQIPQNLFVTPRRFPGDWERIKNYIGAPPRVSRQTTERGIFWNLCWASAYLEHWISKSFFCECAPARFRVRSVRLVDRTWLMDSRIISGRSSYAFR